MSQTGARLLLEKRIPIWLGRGDSLWTLYWLSRRIGVTGVTRIMISRHDIVVIFFRLFSVSIGHKESESENNRGQIPLIFQSKEGKYLKQIVFCTFACTLMPLNALTRAANLKVASNTQFDVIIIGGGITGAGIALDAAL